MEFKWKPAPWSTALSNSVMGTSYPLTSSRQYVQMRDKVNAPILSSSILQKQITNFETVALIQTTLKFLI